MEDFKKDEKLQEEILDAGVDETVSEASETATPEAAAPETATPEEAPTEEQDSAKNEALLRTVAEYQNYRKRVEKEKQDIMKYANEKILKDLITVHDNFERAIGTMDKDNEALASVISGIEMIKKSFDDVLDRYGVKEIDAEGKPFSPEHHHAVMTEDAEGIEGNTVLEVFQKGYTLHERVIRPAMVKVSN